MATRPSDLADELASFRSERLELINNDMSPLALVKGPKVVLHLIPKTAFDRSTLVSLDSQGSQLLPLFGGGAYNSRFNFDGPVTYFGDTDGVESYVQLFYSGAIEAVYVFAERHGKTLAALKLRSKLIELTTSCFKEQQRLGVKLPIIVVLSLLGVKGCRLAIGNDHDQYPIDRDALLIPEILVDSFDCDVRAEMKSIFDRLWNAGGASRCYEYDK